jgi:hypothetical protein
VLGKNTVKKINIFILGALVCCCSCKNDQRMPEIKYANEVVSKPIPFAEGVISNADNSKFELTFSTDGLETYF